MFTLATLPDFRYLYDLWWPQNNTAEVTEKPKKISKKKFKALLNKVNKGEIGQRLDLSNQGITDKHFLKLLVALRESKLSKVLEMNLSKNMLTQNIIDDLSFYLKANPQVSKIDLSLNKINASGAYCLLAFLETNTTIIYLNLIANPVNNDFLLEVELQAPVKRNAEIQDEKNNLPYYIAVAAVSRAFNSPLELVLLIMDYCNQTSIPAARDHIEKTLYSQAIRLADDLSLIEAVDIAQKILPDLSEPTLDEQIITERISQIQQEHTVLDQKRSLVNNGGNPSIVFSNKKNYLCLSNLGPRNDNIAKNGFKLKSD